MEELQNTLQFWKNFGYYGGALAFAVGGAIGLISYYKTTNVENLIRAESDRSDSLSRNQFLDKLDMQLKQQQAIQEKQELLLKNKQIDNAVKVIPPEPTKTNPEDNFRYEIDTQNKILKFWPKTGEWKKPIIAYPSQESEIVQGKFTSQAGFMMAVMEGINNDHKLFFFVASGGPSASKNNYYGLEYNSLLVMLLSEMMVSPCGRLI